MLRLVNDKKSLQPILLNRYQSSTCEGANSLQFCAQQHSEARCAFSCQQQQLGRVGPLHHRVPANQKQENDAATGTSCHLLGRKEPTEGATKYKFKTEYDDKSDGCVIG